MKKIYITSLHLMHGGVEMAITLLANALVKRGYDVEILCIYNLGRPVYVLDKRVKVTYLSNVHPNREEFKRAIRAHNILEIFKEGVYALRVLYLKRKLLALKIKEIDNGIIISTRNEHSIFLSRYGKQGVKKIAQLHHDHNFDKRLMEDFKKRYRNIDVFVLLTEELRKEVEAVMIENKHTKCVVIPNFLEELQKQENSERRNQVLAVGRLHEVKGFKRMIEMWRDADMPENAFLKIIGDGEEKEELQKLIKKNGLEEKVILTGAMQHEDVMDEMRKSQIYAMTSLSEAFPFVLIEAMSNGLPVVAYDVRVGPRAIVEEQKNGFLIPDGDKKQFGEKVKMLLEDIKLRERMSDGAVKRSREFMEENVMKKWTDILEV